jgi:hypothetical protein
MPCAERPAGHLAPVTGLYRLLNVFGTPTQIVTRVVQDQPLPGTPTGHSWKLEREADGPKE